MKVFLREAVPDYAHYHFPYSIWAEIAPDQSPEVAYQNGFLPYSADPDDPRHLFYLARSLRIDLAHLGIGKKRRYDHRQWQRHALRRQLLSKSTFLLRYGDRAGALAQTWMRQRFGNPYLSDQRLQYIMAKPFLNEVVIWELPDEDHMVAFALIVRLPTSAHYWFAFYDADPGGADGHGFLTDFVLMCKEAGLQHAYLGTAYGDKARYKFRGFQGRQFWDGNAWISGLLSGDEAHCTESALLSGTIS